MNPRAFVVFTLVSVVLGVVAAGLYSNGTSSAFAWTQFWIGIPVRTGGNIQMNCGWHKGPCGGPVNESRPWALDWSPLAYPNTAPADNRVFFTATGYTSDSTAFPMGETIAQNRPYTYTGCEKNVIVDLVHYIDASWLTSIGFTHAINPTGNGTIVYAGTTYPGAHFQVATIQTLNNDPACNIGNGQWTGPHAHTYEAVSICQCGGITPTYNTTEMSYSQSATGPYSLSQWVYWFQFYNPY